MIHPHVTTLWHELECITAASERAHALSNFPQAEVLLARRAALIAQITQHVAEEATAKGGAVDAVKQR